MDSRPSLFAVAMVLLAATLWGVGGLFVHRMIGAGLTPVQVAYYSNGLAFLLLGGGLALFARGYLAVGWRSLPGLLAVGVVSGGIGALSYTSAVAMTSVSLAVLLLYTSPAWVVLLGWRLLGEPIERRRVIAVIVAFGWCALVAQVYDVAALRASLIGILYGLLAGFTYALSSVMSKRVLRQHHPLSVSVYSFCAAALVLLPLQSAPLPIEVPPQAWPWLIAWIVGVLLIAIFAFNLGLRSLSAGLVSLLIMWQLIVAIPIGVLVLGDSMELQQVIGALLVIASVLILRPTSSATPPQPAPLVVEVPAR